MALSAVHVGRTFKLVGSNLALVGNAPSDVSLVPTQAALWTNTLQILYYTAGRLQHYYYLDGSQESSSTDKSLNEECHTIHQWYHKSFFKWNHTRVASGCDMLLHLVLVMHIIKYTLYLTIGYKLTKYCDKHIFLWVLCSKCHRMSPSGSFSTALANMDIARFLRLTT